MFRMDSPFMNFMSKMSDLLILNLLIIFCSLPIFTMGASLTAGYYVLYKQVKKEEGYVFRGFFKAFKENFKQSTIIWLIVLFVFAIFFIDYRILFYSGMEFASWKWLKILVFATITVACMGLVYIFPLQARFSNTIKNTIKNAFLMSISHFPITILAILALAIPFVIAMFSSWFIPIVILFAFSGVMYLQSFMFLHVFKKYEPEPEPESDKKTDDSGIFAGSDSLEAKGIK